MNHKVPAELLLIVFLTFLSYPVFAQQSGKIEVPLKIRQTDQPTLSAAWTEFDDRGAENSKPSKLGAVRHGHLPGGIRVALEALNESPKAYKVTIDTNDDGSLSDETPLFVRLNSTVTVNLMRRWGNGKSALLPYTLSMTQLTERGERFYWSPRYDAEGSLKIGKCQASIELLDANGDGVFDRNDFKHVTTLHIDDGTGGGSIDLNDPRVIKHSDGRIEIPQDLQRSVKRTWHNGEEILEICGESFLVDSLAPDGSGLFLAQTKFVTPKIGDLLPQWLRFALSEQAIDPKSLNGTVTLLDFWTSWCGVCVGEFPEIKQLVEVSHSGFKVISVNVDEKDSLPRAREVSKQYGLTWPEIATGKGEQDLLWKVFGNMSNQGLFVPLYVLVDQNGTIRYAGSGGEKLTELRARLKEAGVR